MTRTWAKVSIFDTFRFSERAAQSDYDYLGPSRDESTARRQAAARYE